MLSAPEPGTPAVVPVPAGLADDGRSMLRDAPSRAIEWVGRVGLAAYGVVHLVVAGLGVKIVLDGRGRTHVDQRAAVATIASEGTPGLLLLAGGAITLMAFAVWQVRAAAIGFRWVETPGERWRKRSGAVGKAVGVLSVAWVAARFVLQAPGRRRGLRTLSTELFAMPGGRLLVGAVGAVVLATAVGMLVTGLRRSFMGDLLLGRLHPRLHRVTPWLGSAGNLTRALAFGTLGTLTVAAVVADRPDRVGGVDHALQVLADSTGGDGLIVAVSLGFAAYGAYCVLDAWARHP